MILHSAEETAIMRIFPLPDDLFCNSMSQVIFCNFEPLDSKSVNQKETVKMKYNTRINEDSSEIPSEHAATQH